MPSRHRSALLAALLLLTACLDRGPALIPAAQAADASVEKTLSFKGSPRSYRLFVPAGVDRSKPLPLILALHGGWGTARNQEEITGLNAPAAAAGFVVAYPEGLLRAWNAGSCCAQPMKNNIDDVGFLKAVVDDIAKTLPINRQRIYGTGLSNGAMMVHRAACEAPDLFAAIAPVAGGLMLPSCKASTPVSALLIQGRADARIPWDGGVFEGNARPSMRSVAGILGARNGCDSKETISRQQGITTCYTLPGCKAGSEVSWCGLEGVGHQWPGGRELLPRLLGKNTLAFNASQEAVDFFKRH